MSNELKVNNVNESFWKDLFSGLAVFFYMLYILPCAIVLIFNFFQFVVFGSCKISEFNWAKYSYQQINDFYLWLWRWCEYLKYRLWHG